MLNDAQRRAVEHPRGPALVLAGAGSGKTRVIVERMAWLVSERGVDARNILALTFTNKAAGELRGRVAQRLDVETVPAWVGTFHSFGLFALRRDADKLGRNKNLTIFDDADQLSLMKHLMQDASSPRSLSPREVLWWISRQKQDVLMPDSTEAETRDSDGLRVDLWRKYESALWRTGAVDFDDLLVLLVRMLEDFPDLRRKYQDRYRYVLVDEYQDTNHAQYRIAKGLCAEHGNLFAVGDEDQAIYSWRGATIRNILDFERDFPETTVYRLEQNYRSTAPILASANSLVSNNEQRIGKTLKTDRREGEPVRYYEAEDGDDEARFVVEDLISRKLRPGSVAVIFRTNGQSRLMEEALRRKGIAYVVVGGVQFYGRKEIKDILAFLRLAVNPSDDVSVRRVVNVPPRGLGATSLEHIEEYAAKRQQPLLSVLREVEMDLSLSSRAREGAAAFVHIIDDLALAAKTKPVKEVVELLLNKTGYREHVAASDEKDAKARVELIDEFLSACVEYDERKGGDLLSFLQDLALISDVDTWDANTPAVTLVTCHSAKGLEFDHVFLIGLEEGLLPHASAKESAREIEEERRLCYVAMTRARDSLVLSSARRRLLYGEHGNREVSRFVAEIGHDRLTFVRPRGDDDPRVVRARPDAPRTEPGRLKMGVKVWHAQFGKGVVMYTSGSGNKQRAHIRFQTGRSRDFMVSAAPLKILDGDEK
ncbi:MAG: UvrD-helicase domain-containing protein [Candidatus Hydrogenedentes bacterium]|nr:UvrD-helicase domain-containing protein [Candidatus Hydrogenedentota bacterium]